MLYFIVLSSVIGAHIIEIKEEEMKRFPILKGEDVEASIFLSVLFGLCVGFLVPIAYIIEEQVMSSLTIFGCLAFGPATAIMITLIFADFRMSVVVGATATISTGLGLCILADPLLGLAGIAGALTTRPAITILAFGLRAGLIKIAAGLRYMRSRLRIAWLIHKPAFMYRWARRRQIRRRSSQR